MPKGGAKRKTGKREQNGRIQRETGYETKLPTLKRRCKALGWKPTPENVRKVDKFGGTYPGMCYLSGMLNRRQYEAADWFAVSRSDYLRAIDAPPATAKAASYGDASGASLVAENIPRARVAIDTYHGAVRAVGCNLHVAAVIAFVEEQAVDKRMLLPALDILAAHLNIESDDG